MFNALRGQLRRDAENARMTGYYASMIHAQKGLAIKDFGLFPWEKEQDYAPVFSKVDPEAFERIKAFKFPGEE